MTSATSDIDKVGSRVSDNDPLHERIRQALCVPTRSYLWAPEDAIEFVPALCSTVWGDGLGLLGVSTINDRPAYWIVRVGHGWRINTGSSNGGIDSIELLEDILQELDYEFGCGRPDYDHEDPDMRDSGLPYPAIDDSDGYHWFRLKWPEGVARKGAAR